MISACLSIFLKDLRLILGRGSGLLQAILLGFLLIFLFSLSTPIGETSSARGAAAIFWMASVFCQVLIASTLYGYEESNGQRTGLLLGRAPIQSVWLGKSAAALVVLLLAQSLFLPGIAVFLGLSWNNLWPYALAILLLADLGSIGIVSLLGAVSQGHSSKESLLCIILFPLLVPLLLAGISVFAAAFDNGATNELTSWLRIAAAFDAIFLGAAYMLFPFIYNAD